MIKNDVNSVFHLPYGIRLIDLKHRTVMPASEHHFCIALGNFDGVHSAHRMLLAAAVRTAATFDRCHSAVFCFDPPSSDFLGNVSLGGRHLSSFEEKLSAFADCGIEYVFLADFPTLRDMEPQTFISNILQEVCRASGVVCGFNFRFGKKGAGTPALLKNVFGDQNCQTVAPCCMPVGNNATLTVISSSAVRSALLEGQVEIARLLKGEPYTITSSVVWGKQLGRTMGIPTINQYFPIDKIIPASGIYVTRCRIGDRWISGISNIGNHPTVDDNAPVNCETHLLGFDQEIYGQPVTVEFLHRLRDEKRFSSIEELKAAIEQDIQNAIAFFDATPTLLT